MMTTAALLGFTLIALLTVITPGMESMLVVRYSLVGGRRAGLASLDSASNSPPSHASAVARNVG